MHCKFLVLLWIIHWCTSCIYISTFLTSKNVTPKMIRDTEDWSNGEYLEMNSKGTSGSQIAEKVSKRCCHIACHGFAVRFLFSVPKFSTDPLAIWDRPQAWETYKRSETNHSCQIKTEGHVPTSRCLIWTKTSHFLITPGLFRLTWYEIHASSVLSAGSLQYIEFPQRGVCRPRS